MVQRSDLHASRNVGLGAVVSATTIGADLECGNFSLRLPAVFKATAVTAEPIRGDDPPGKDGPADSR